MSEKFKRSTPEEALEKIKLEGRGHLKIFLGYAPGVGKTYAMLNEAHRRHNRGQNVAIGLIETHNRIETINQIKNLKIIPPKKIMSNNSQYNEVDVDAIIAKKPGTILIDDLGHVNVRGSKNIHRYKDIEEILEHGINVLTTLNIEHIKSLNLTIKKITGIKFNETLPDSIIEKANEVVLIDISPDELLIRLKNNVIFQDYSSNKTLMQLFSKTILSDLRELSLRLTAEGVDEHLAEYMKEHGIHENWHTVERVMVCISGNPNSKRLIHKGARIAAKYKCEWYVVNVFCTNIFAYSLSKKNKQTLKNNYKLAKKLGADVVNLSGKSVPKTLASFAAEKYITQIIIGSSRKTKAQYFLRGSTVTRLIKYTKNIEFHVIPSE